MSESVDLSGGHVIGQGVLERFSAQIPAPWEGKFLCERKKSFSGTGDKTIRTYNDAGLCVRTTDYDVAGNIRCDIHYDLDPLQRVVGWKVFDAKEIP